VPLNNHIDHSIFVNLHIKPLVMSGF